MSIRSAPLGPVTQKLSESRGSPAASAAARIGRLPAGSAVVSGDRQVWLPYDLQRSESRPADLEALPAVARVHRASSKPFSLDTSQHACLSVINGMGVALGDSLVGLSALHWLVKARPGLDLHLYRANKSPSYVEETYALAKPWLRRVHYLPVPLARLTTPGGPVVDLGDFVHWPEFAHMPMIDFFLWALGVDPASVPLEAKANRWLQEVPLPACEESQPYVFFSPVASTPLRSLPEDMWPEAVDRLWRFYKLPVRGYVPVAHTHYRNVSPADTASFLSCVAGASVVLSVDTAAVHAAAGFDVPTLAFFNTIDPALRVASYAHCTAVDLRAEGIEGLHASEDLSLLAIARESWERAMSSGWRLPDLQHRGA